MVAIEGGLKSKSGEIYNELPDRFADALFLIGSGYATADSAGITFGYIAALLAVITAYVRALGVVAGASQQFSGPMAKPHRMALLTVACILQGLTTVLNHHYPVLFWALVLIILGCLLTIARRTSRIIRELESK
jgi:phosphatidylglycerophosphate synthase